MTDASVPDSTAAEGMIANNEFNVLGLVVDGDSLPKRAREDVELEAEDNGGAKKPKLEKDKTAEEQKVEIVKDTEVKCEEVNLGPKSFGSSVEMFEYFMKFLHFWTPNLNLNKYEHIMLMDLLKKGHAEAEKKIGTGISAFQVRNHPMFKSRCFFLIRDDGSVDDFSFRKCVNHILPLPENMMVKSHGGGRGGRGGGGHGGGGGRGRGRGGGGGKWRN